MFKCPICDRETPDEYQEEHHLIPKCKKGKETATMCCSCGDMVHQLIEVKDMARIYNTIDSIKSHEGMQKWAKWISKKPNDFSVCMRRKKRK